MSDLDDLFRETDNDSDLVKSLRKALKEANTKRAEAQAELDRRSKADRTRSLADVLKEKGVSEKAAKYFPADVDPTPEAVDKWLDEDGDLFGFQRQSVSNETRDAAQRITNATAGAPSGGTTFDPVAIAEMLRNAKTPE